VVPEILMSTNLVSSPELTPTVHSQGRVVMQAIVDRHGDVTHVHIVSGNPTLHQAAVDAALSRRYRPYLLNGKPVDVATTISIDFPGNR
jgi:outer membrane biosynthesis protein TonB